MNMWSRQKQNGFTIVELLVVIVIIAILATITMVVYGNVQDRARDARRVTDMKNIYETLKVYGNSKKSLPNEQGSNWETSVTYPDTFISALETSGLVGDVPIDPINDASHHYRYYLYPAGYDGCEVGKGSFFVLQVINLDKGSEKAAGNPGFACTRNWTGEAWYTVGGYLYE